MNKNKTCLFCKISKNTGVYAEDIIYQNDKIIVMLDADWAVKGHTLVIWKKHVENISDLSKEEYAQFSEIMRKTEKVLLKELKVEKSVILKSGGLISHFHFHIYPVKKTTSWQTVKDIFDKKTKYEISSRDKCVFITRLRSKLL